MTSAYRPFDGDAWLGRAVPLIDGPYRVLPETAFDVSAEMAFARQGRKARVFKLLGPDGAPYALKTFYRGFSLPEYGPITESLLTFGDIPGLRTCRRRLVAEDEAETIGEPGLAYAVVMPWIEGVAWAGVVEVRYPLAEESCLALATQTASILARMEARQLAHADISSTNVLIIDAEHGPAIELIDVEDMYHESFGSLPHVPDGSPGYAHPRNRGRGCRSRHGDRFAGAILLTEMLVWHDPAVRRSAADISVFDQVELCRGGAKYDLVRKILQTRSADVAALFERVWDSPGLAGCPTLAEWATATTTVSPAGRPQHRPPQVLRRESHIDRARGTPPDAAPPDAPPPDGMAAAVCPGCGGPASLRHPTAEHAPTCPLRPPERPAPAPGTSSFPAVPMHDDISFIPLFGADGP